MLLAPLGLLLGGLWFTLAQVAQGMPDMSQVVQGMPDIRQNFTTLCEVLGVRDILLFLVL